MNCELPAKTSYKGECSSWGAEGDFLSTMLMCSQSGRRARVRCGYLEAQSFLLPTLYLLPVLCPDRVSDTGPGWMDNVGERCGMSGPQE